MTEGTMSDPEVTNVQINLAGPNGIQVQVVLREPACRRHACVHDVEQALDQLEAWLSPSKVRPEPYRVAVSVTGSDGTIQEAVWPNRYLALYFIATTLAGARPAELRHRWPPIPAFAMDAGERDMHGAPCQQG
jgi:hypothetical protein